MSKLGSVSMTVQEFNNMQKATNSKVSSDTLAALETKLGEVAKTMRENKTILAYEMIRTLQEFVAYERAKQSAQ